MQSKSSKNCVMPTGKSTGRSNRGCRVLVGFRLVEALRDVLSGVGAYVKQHELNWRIHCVDADEFGSSLRPQTTDGAMTVITPNSHKLIIHAQRRGVPLVNLLHDAHPLLPSVLSDDLAIGAAGARHLMQRGFKTFAFLGLKTQWSEGRQRGFTRALARAGYPCQVCRHFATIDDYRLIGERLAANALRHWVVGLTMPLAVMVCSDAIARVLLSVCEEMSLAVPEQVSILGVDNLIATCELATVPLSSVAQDFPRLGFEAARILDHLMSGGAAPKRPKIIAPAEVVVRKSTDVLAFDDEYVSAAMRLIHGRAADGIRMKELLRQVPVSRRWLDMRFKTLTGHTASEEIRTLRKLRLRDLLVNTDLSIKQIALRCGFPNVENMIRFFRNAYGSPPQAYRMRQSRTR